MITEDMVKIAGFIPDYVSDKEFVSAHGEYVGIVGADRISCDELIALTGFAEDRLERAINGMKEYITCFLGSCYWQYSYSKDDFFKAWEKQQQDERERVEELDIKRRADMRGKDNLEINRKSLITSRIAIAISIIAVAVAVWSKFA